MSARAELHAAPAHDVLDGAVPAHAAPAHDVVVVGSGIAGLTCALRLRETVDRVLLVTNTVLSAGSTQLAQCGIAAALYPEDTPD